MGEPSISCFIWEDITLQKKRGVAILINKSLPFFAEKVIQDTMGRYVMVVGSGIWLSYIGGF